MKRKRDPFKKLYSKAVAAAQRGGVHGTTPNKIKEFAAMNDIPLRAAEDFLQTKKEESGNRYAIGECVTPASLKNKFLNDQGGRCYWMPNYKIDPMLIFEIHQPMAMSLDRLDNSRGYFLDNIVITVTGINRMRNECPADKFRIILDYWMSLSTDGPIGLSPLFAEYREDLLK